MRLVWLSQRNSTTIKSFTFQLIYVLFCVPQQSWCGAAAAATAAVVVVMVVAVIVKYCTIQHNNRHKSGAHDVEHTANNAIDHDNGEMKLK